MTNFNHQSQWNPAETENLPTVARARDSNGWISWTDLCNLDRFRQLCACVWRWIQHRASNALARTYWSIDGASKQRRGQGDLTLNSRDLFPDRSWVKQRWP